MPRRGAARELAAVFAGGARALLTGPGGVRPAGSGVSVDALWPAEWTQSNPGGQGGKGRGGAPRRGAAHAKQPLSKLRALIAQNEAAERAGGQRPGLGRGAASGMTASRQAEDRRSAPWWCASLHTWSLLHIHLLRAAAIASCVAQSQVGGMNWR